MIRYSHMVGHARVIHVDAEDCVQTIMASYVMLSSANLVCTGKCHSKPAVIYEFD